MKKIGLGIAIILFGILFVLCISDLWYIALVIGVVGLSFALAGCGSDNNE
ncbi:MAG: hypothetical protein PUB37_05270 [Firmicutes bacterium]|nr:hypothetical protein [Bacillota bacterium]